MSNPDTAQTIKDLKFLSSPGGELMDDGHRLTSLILTAHTAITHIEQLTAIVAHLEAENSRLAEENSDYKLAQKTIIGTIRKLCEFIESRGVDIPTDIKAQVK